MRSIGFALICAAALSACSGKTQSTAADTVAYTDYGQPPSARLQAKAVVAPAAPAIAFGAVAGQVATRREDVTTLEEPIEQNATTDKLQNVTSASTTMLIRTGQAFIEVGKLDPGILKIRQLAAQAGGYITNSSISGGRDQIRQASIEIKIPNSQYDQAVSSLRSIGKVETVNSHTEDVGEEFVDVTARVTNARRLEDRLISLLATRTGKLDEVLRVERELARVREEIERYEGRLRYLSSRVAMSTLTVNLHEPAPIIEPGRNPIGEAFRRAWQNFVAMLAALIASLGVLVPIGLIGLGGWIGYRRWIKWHGPLTA